MDITNDSLYNDTVSYVIGADSGLVLPFKTTYNNSLKKLSKVILFFKFETPNKSVYFEGPDEVIKVFSYKTEPNLDHQLKFLITDSLFHQERRLGIRD